MASLMSDLIHPDDLLLQAARSNNIAIVSDLLMEASRGKIDLNIDCKGREKKNQSWTPLHLAAYFGHKDVVEVLLKYGADIDAINDAGDTPLHKAAYTGRMELVLLLLQHNASVQVVNGEGFRASQLPGLDFEVKGVLEASAKAETKKAEENLLKAAREGDIQMIRHLLRSTSPTSFAIPHPPRLPLQTPSVNCIDMFGNSPLHCASYRGQKEAAAILLQHGADASLRNLRGQRPIDMATADPKMRQILEITPNRQELTRGVKRAEGLVLKKSRVFGWKPIWLVLERGVLSVFASRADATTGVNRKSYKYLDDAKVEASVRDKYSFFVTFNDNTSHILSVHPNAATDRNGGPLIDGASVADLNISAAGNHALQSLNGGAPGVAPVTPPELSRQKWMTAIKEHVSFSNYYIKKGFDFDSYLTDDSDLQIPIVSLADAFATAQAHQKVLDEEVKEVTKAIDNVMDQKFWRMFNEATSPTSPSGTKRASSADISFISVSLAQLRGQVSQLNAVSRKMATALGDCLQLFEQQEEMRKSDLAVSEERIRVLQDSLHVLAEQHNDLENSIGDGGRRSKGKSIAGGGIVVNADGKVIKTAATAYRSTSRANLSEHSYNDNSEDYYDINDDMTVMSYHSMDSDSEVDFEVEVLGDLDLDKTPTDEIQFKDQECDEGAVQPPATSKADLNAVVESDDHAARDDGDDDVRSTISRSTTRSSVYQDAEDISRRDSPPPIILRGKGDPRERSNGFVGERNGVENGLAESLNGVSGEMNGVAENGSHTEENGANGVDENGGYKDDPPSVSSDADEFRRASIASLPFEVSAEQRALYPMFSREKLPAPMISRNEFSVWSILKQCMGRDLSQITMPVVFNEPLSMLQRISENMEYALLLEKAARAKSPLARLQYITAFAASATAANFERLGKPFNPLLGETFELRRDTYCFVAEQVSHHPPISAFHAESPNWKFHGSVSPKTRFWGKSLEVQPKGAFTVELVNHGEVYSWNNVNCCVHNIIVGKLWIEHYGCLEVKTHYTDHVHAAEAEATGIEPMRSLLNYKPGGWTGGQLNKLDGFIVDKFKHPVRALRGNWTDSLWTMRLEDDQQFVDNESVYNGIILNKSESSIAYHAQRQSDRENGGSTTSEIKVTEPLPEGAAYQASGCNGTIELPKEIETGPEEDDLPETEVMPADFNVPEIHHLPSAVCLWKADPRPSESETYYNFTLFAMMLNELNPDQTSRLPPTDSRLRPDIRCLENGDLDGAANEKARLEEKQRETRRRLKKMNHNWKTCWFNEGRNPVTGTPDWIFNTDYWKRDWSMTPDIF